MKSDRNETDDGSISRRRMLGVAAGLLALPTALRMGGAHAASSATTEAAGGVKALTFDIQGTVFDYYQPFVRISAALAARKAMRIDWSGFLVEWNAGAGAIIQAIIANGRQWVPPGQIFRESLETVLSARGLASQLDGNDRLELLSVWGQMVPWPDSAGGIARLKRTFTVATLSNAGTAGVIAIAKHGGLAFDAVLTGEFVHSYKPSADVYHAASTYLGFPPGEIMMVAAHRFDLKAAKAAGFKTAYIPRPFELGPETKVDRSLETYIDIIADDLIDLSAKLDPA